MGQGASPPSPALPDGCPPAPRPLPHAPLIVVSGPSGVGKTTVVNRLLTTSGLRLRRAVTATTRKPRDGETDGVDYHFWSEDEFRRALDDGRMLESAVVFNRDFYGTPRSEVDPYRAQGVGVILVIDVQGAATVRKLYPGDHLSVFISVPTFDELEARLRLRQTESEERIRRRLEEARRELARQAEFDRVIVNQELGQAVRELEQLVRAEFTARGC
jgi:guanylate kinase